jgi:hypothetical protein
MTAPFVYPATAHVRRHGPAGYADYASYRPWPRDEFTFRCVFCLRREQWGRAVAEFEIDHLDAVSLWPDLATDYDNLLLACGSCNCRKRNRPVPDPTAELLAAAVTVRVDGTIEANNDRARQVVRVLQLDAPEVTEFRAMWIQVIRLAATYDPELYRRLLRFPADLPDLAALRPPGGNSRPDGIEQSYFRRRERGELPDIY